MSEVMVYCTVVMSEDMVYCTVVLEIMSKKYHYRSTIIAHACTRARVEPDWGGR